MLSLFPTLLSCQQLSPFLIRITLGFILLFWAYKGLRDSNHSSGKKVIDLGEVIIAILLLLGLWTQAAAGIAAIGLLVCLIGKVRSRAFLTDGLNYTLILFVLALSLMFTGAGWWGFDMPL